MGLFRRSRSDESRRGDTADSPWAAPESSDQMSEQVSDLTLLSLHHALDSIEEGGPLIPFVIVESGDSRQLHRFVAERLEEGVAKAQEFIGTDAGWQRAALAYDGYLSMGGASGRPLARLEGPLYLGSAPPPGRHT